jgi:hypothetical protein
MVPVGRRAAEPVAKNPERSNRAIAAELGVAPNSVKAARDKLAGQDCSPEKPIGRVGFRGTSKNSPRCRGVGVCGLTT